MSPFLEEMAAQSSGFGLHRKQNRSRRQAFKAGEVIGWLRRIMRQQGEGRWDRM